MWTCPLEPSDRGSPEARAAPARDHPGGACRLTPRRGSGSSVAPIALRPPRNVGRCNAALRRRPMLAEHGASGNGASVDGPRKRGYSRAMRFSDRKIESLAEKLVRWLEAQP